MNTVTAARASFAGLAAVVTLVVLSAVTQIASSQGQDVQLTQVRSDAAMVATAYQADKAPLQIVVITASELDAANPLRAGIQGPDPKPRIAGLRRFWWLKASSKLRPHSPP